MKIIFDNNTGYVDVELLNERTRAPLNTATVTANIKDSAGVSISGSIGLNYVTGTHGEYTGTLPYTLPIVNKVMYTLHVDATQDGIVGHWELPVLGRTRDSTSN